MVTNSLYNQEGKLIDNLHVSKERFLFLILPDGGNFKIISTDSYFIDENNNIIQEYNGKTITLYIGESLFVDFHINKEEYRIKFSDTNKIPEHYNTLIQNKNLPDNNKIINSIVDENKYMVLGKLLLEYKNIIKFKGTITVVKNFLNFIGFENIQVYTEYKDGDNLTLINGIDSVKTGNYHVIYEHDYTNGKDFDNKNFFEYIRDDNVDDFVDVLFVAIQTAKEHFLIPEQDISFFASNFVTKVPRYLSIAQNTTVLNNTNPSYYVENEDIFNIEVYINNLLNKQLLVDNCVINDNNFINNQEIKFIPKPGVNINQNIFYISREIKDNELNQETDILNLQTRFGTIINLNLTIPGKYLNYSIKNLDIPMIQINKNDKEYINGIYLNHVYIDRPGTYELVFDFYDNHNNRERFIYNIVVNQLSDKINFEYFSSGETIKLPSRPVISNTDLIEPNLIIEFDNINGLITEQVLSRYFTFDYTDVEYLKVTDNKIFALIAQVEYFGLNKDWTEIGNMLKLIELDNYLQLTNDVESLPYDKNTIKYLNIGTKIINSTLHLNSNIDTIVLREINKFYVDGTGLSYNDNITYYNKYMVDGEGIIFDDTSTLTELNLQQLSVIEDNFKIWNFNGNVIDIHNVEFILSPFRSDIILLNPGKSYTDLTVKINSKISNHPSIIWLINQGVNVIIDSITFEIFDKSFEIGMMFSNYFLNNNYILGFGEIDADINLDVESTMLTDILQTNIGEPIHNLNDFTDLTKYFDNKLSTLNKYTNLSLTDNLRHVETEFNFKYKTADVSNMPLTLINNWIDFTSYNIVDENVDIIFDDLLDEIGFKFIDRHKVMIWDICETTDVIKKYLVVMNLQPGVNNDILIHDNLTYNSETKLPLNYDFDVIDPDDIESRIYYKSLYPRLTNNTKILKLNDIIYCKPNLNYVINFQDVTWKLYDSFTKELLFESNQYSLKYRIKENIFFDVEMNLKINGVFNKVYKEKIFSSFDLQI